MDPEMVEKTIWGFLKTRGTFLGIPIIRTACIIFGCILGYVNFGKLPFRPLFYPSAQRKAQELFHRNGCRGRSCCTRRGGTWLSCERRMFFKRG